jgi:hypothetical protein
MLDFKQWQHRSFYTLPEQYSDAVALNTHFVLTDSEDANWTGPDNEIKKLLVNEFGQVPAVQAVYAYVAKDEMTIWTLLERYDRDAREQVYEKELKLCDLLHIYDFDFRVTSIDLVDPDELVRTGSRKIYWRQ